MVPVHRKQRVLCLCSWLPAGAALTGSLAATITSCVAQGTGIRPPPRGEEQEFKNKTKKKIIIGTTQEDEKKYRQVGKDESHLTLRRHDCAGAGRAPWIPRGIPFPLHLHPLLQEFPPRDGRSPPCRIHHPGTAGTSVLLVSPEQLWPRGEGAQGGPWQQQPCPCPRSGRAEEAGWVSTAPGSGGAPSPSPAGLRCSSMHGADSRRFQTTFNLLGWREMTSQGDK